MLRDTSDLPDLGWHYDPLDYLLNQVDLSADLTLNGGVAWGGGVVVGMSGVYGVKLFNGASMASQADSLAPNRVTRYATVQEQPMNLSGNVFIQADQNAYGQITLQFTDFTLAQGRTRSLVNCSGTKPFSELSIRDCQLRNAYLSVYVASDLQFPPVTVELENNLIENSYLSFYQHYYGANSYLSLTARNNLFRRGNFYLTYFYNDQYYSQNPDWWVQDNLFDQATQSLYTGGGSGYEWETYVTRSHNGFTTGTANNLDGSYDKPGLAPDFEKGPLGDYYYLAGGDLYQQLIDAGSRTALDASLSDTTVTLDQAPDGDDVDIGYHFGRIQPPTAFPAGLVSFPYCGGQPAEIQLFGFDPQNFPLTFIKVTDPSGGQLSAITPINETSAQVFYTADPGFCGVDDAATFKVSNGWLDSAPATITATVGDPSPFAEGQDVMTGVDTPAMFTLSGSDQCNGNLTYNRIFEPGHGTITAFDPMTGSVTYEPELGYEGLDDSFTFTAGACGFESGFANVSIAVVSPPVLTTDCRQQHIVLHWTVPAWLENLPFQYFDDFKIYRCETADCTPTVLYHTVTDPDARSWVDTGVEQGKTYCYRVTFTHQGGTQTAPQEYESPFSDPPSCSQLCPTPSVLITGNRFSSAGVATYDFTDGSLVNSFVVDGATLPNASGRGIAVFAGEVFYTEVFCDIFGNCSSDSIHVCPFGIEGSGGADTRLLPNPRPTVGIQDLDFHNGALYVLTGYASNPLQVYKLDPATGSVLAGPIPIGSPAEPDADGFTLLPSGNFLINDGDGPLGGAVYREYDGTTGVLVTGGLVIDLQSFGFSFGTGVALAPDGQSLYFIADFETFVQTDLTGSLLGTRIVGDNQFEDIEVVVP